MWNTRLTQLLGIDYPIVQGAMAYISESTLVSAVCRAGGTGVIATGGLPTEHVREEIRKCKELTDKPFGVNLMLQSPNKDDIAQLVCDEKVAFVTIGAGNPVPYFEPLHKAGVKCIPVVPSVKLAKRVQEKGADALVIEGMEAGGHDGMQTCMALMENVIPEVEIPVIAAGGIADGRAVAAALIMGASGVQIGSRFLVAEECQVHKNFKEAILNATDTDSVLMGFTKNSNVRGLRNAFAEAYLKKEYSGAPTAELNTMAAGTNKKAAVGGDITEGFVQVGQSLNRLTKIESVADIMNELTKDAEDRLRNGLSYIGK